MYVIGTLKEAQKIKGVFPDVLFEAVCKDCEILDAEYGDDRNYYVRGGFAVIIDDNEDFLNLKNLIDFNIDMYELFNVIDSASYVSSVYVINDDFAISLFMPESIAPDSILNAIKSERKD